MDEKDLFRALRAAIDDGRVRVDLDLKRLQHTDSPIALQADVNRWLYGVIAAALAVGFTWDWMRGLVALALGVVFYFGLGRRWVRGRMRARFHDRVLADIAQFKKIWRLRGVTLIFGDAQCASPDCDWRRFVLDRL